MAKEGAGKGKLAKRIAMFVVAICRYARSMEGKRVGAREGGEVAEEQGMRRRVTFEFPLRAARAAARCPGSGGLFASGLFAVYSLSASSRKSLISAA